MFLCDDCHDVSKHFDTFRSYGKCEDCGKTKACIDCHYTQCESKKEKEKK